MKKLILSVFCLFSFFYLLRYEGYYFDPCTRQPGGGISCLAINGYKVAPNEVICPTLTCARKHLDEKGINHLEGVWVIEILWFGNSPMIQQIKKLKIVPSYDLEEEK